MLTTEHGLLTHMAAQHSTLLTLKRRLDLAI